MYLVNSKVRRRVKEKGFRISPSFMNQMDAAVERIIDGAIEFTKPQKTLSGETLVTYLARHGLK